MIVQEAVARLLSRPGPRLLVLGDLILDTYLAGSVRRISPEAPIPVLDWKSQESRLGGAANVARNLAALGCRVILSGYVGDDAAGERLLALAQEAGMDSEGVLVAPGRPTTEKTRVMAGTQQIVRIDREMTHSFDPSLEAELLDRLRAFLPGLDGCICSDYSKGALGGSLLTAFLDETQAAGKRTFVDPKGPDPGRYHGAYALTPNLREAGEALGMEVGSALDGAAQVFFDATGCQVVLLTRGSEGMTLFERGVPPVHIPTTAREVFDVTGAGDTVIATFAMGILCGLTPVEAARVANLTAGIVVGHLGTAVVRPQELRRAASTEGLESVLGKVVSGDRIATLVSEHRAAGRTVVFTNGCFDLLHAGHIHLLERARRFGDLLVVGLNGDESVRELKGAGRPILPQEQRAQALAALDCVDLVVIFEEPSVLRLIDQVRPDVLVKGAEYELEEVVGAELVRSYNGRVERVPLLPGYSTSKIVQEIRGRPTGEKL